MKLISYKLELDVRVKADESVPNKDISRSISRAIRRSISNLEIEEATVIGADVDMIIDTYKTTL